MKIWTNIFTEETKFNPMELTVFESHPTEADACSALADHVVSMIENRCSVANAAWNDANHEDFREGVMKNVTTLTYDWVKEYFCDRVEQPMRMPCELRNAVRDFIFKEIDALGCYYMCVPDGDEEEYHFRYYDNVLEVV